MSRTSLASRHSIADHEDTLQLETMKTTSGAHPKSARSIFMNSTCASGMSCLNCSNALRARRIAEVRFSTGKSQLRRTVRARTATASSLLCLVGVAAGDDYMGAVLQQLVRSPETDACGNMLTTADAKPCFH